MNRGDEKKVLIKLLLMDSYSVKRLAQFLGTTEGHVNDLLEEIRGEIKIYTDGDFVWSEE